VLVPTGFIIEDDDSLMEVQNSTGGWSEVVKGNFDECVDYYRGQSGLPVKYALRGKYFIFFPTPDAAYTIRTSCYLADTSVGGLASGETNEWLTTAPDLLVAKTGMRVATYIKDQEALAAFNNDFGMAKSRLSILHTARKEANMLRRIGDE
jgi:hypothetical protein